MSWIGCDFHHRRSKQAVFQHVTALQLFDNRVIRRLVRFDHFDGFVKSRIEGLTFGFETLDAKLEACRLLCRSVRSACQFGALRRQKRSAPSKLSITGSNDLIASAGRNPVFLLFAGSVFR
jgi:hypothetical protein